MEEIIRESELRLLSGDITLVKSKIHMSGKYALLELSYKDFFAFVKENNISYVFYQYDFYKLDDYIVTDELLHKYCENSKELAFCKDWANDWNKKINDLDFDRPKYLIIVAEMGNMTIVLVQRDDWLSDDYMIAEDALIDYQESHEEELVEFSDYDEDRISLRDELKDKLLSDKSFRYCTNKSARAVYFQDFIKLKENKKYLSIYRNVRNSTDKQYRLREFIDEIYKEYRNICYKKKIQIGEELPEEDLE